MYGTALSSADTKGSSGTLCTKAKRGRVDAVASIGSHGRVVRRTPPRRPDVPHISSCLTAKYPQLEPTTVPDSAAQLSAVFTQLNIQIHVG